MLTRLLARFLPRFGQIFDQKYIVEHYWNGELQSTVLLEQKNLVYSPTGRNVVHSIIFKRVFTLFGECAKLR